MFRRKFQFVLLIVLAAAALAACGGGGGGQSQEPIKVGAIFDLTGPTSDVGTPYAEGVKGYVEWRNNNGGIDGHPIELSSADYAYKVDQAEQLYSQYTTQDKVIAFMGWGTGDTEALRGRIAEDKVPFMSASYSEILGNPNEAPYNFLVGTGYSSQFIIAIDWAIADWQSKGNSGMPTIALLHHNSPFGLSPWEDGNAYGESLGATMLAIPMPSGATDLTAELTQVEDAGAAYIVVQNVSSPAALLAKNIKDLGVEAQMVCLNWCTDELFISLAGQAGEGVVGTSPFAFPGSDAAGLKVMDDYLKSKGSTLEAKGIRFVGGWLSMQVMSDGIEQVLKAGNELTGENLRSALEGIKNYDTGGITLPLSFSPTDHASNKAVQMFRVENGKWVGISDYLTRK